MTVKELLVRAIEAANQLGVLLSPEELADDLIEQYHLEETVLYVP